MIEATRLAKKVLYQALKDSNVGMHEGLRIKRKEKGLMLDLDIHQKGDQIVSKNERVLLIMDPKDEATIGKSFIYVAKVGEELQLVLRKMNK
ncbi:hypothetical protein ES708_22623 [subsurface metagenome]